MERNEFLSKLGIGLVAVCAGCSLVSCGSGSKGDNPTPAVTAPKAGSGTVFTADLGSELTTIGQSKTSSGVILVRIAAGNVASSFTAVQVACTHEQTSINYDTSKGIFICPQHFSQFSTSGSVLMGPAAIALQKYTVSITGTTLTVSA